MIIDKNLRGFEMDKQEFLIEKLNRLFPYKYNSMAKYVLESDPYVKESEKFVLEALDNVYSTDQLHARRLGELITSLDALPVSGNFSQAVADINYLSIRFGIDHVISDKRKVLEICEDLASFSKGFPDVRRCVLEIQNDDKKLMEELENAREKLTGTVDQSA